LDATAKKMRNKYRGSLLGLALGDSIGYPVEGKGPTQCQEYFNKIINGDFSQVGEPFKSHQITDDTQLTIMLAENLLEHNCLSSQDYADAMVKSFVGGEIVGGGLACKEACTNMLNNIPLFEAAADVNKAGNGTCMRVGPIPLWFISDDPNEIVINAIEQSKITHKDNRCSDGAVIISIALYRLLFLADGFEKFKFIELIQDMVNPIICDETKHAFHILNKLIRKDYDLEKAADYISFNLDELYSRKQTFWNIISPYVLSTVMWSLYSFMMNPDSYEDVLKYSICCGGDVDTTAAISLQLFGAYNGMNALPKNQIHLLNDKDVKRGKYIIELADSIFEKRFCF